jgi:hypothetical protein
LANHRGTAMEMFTENSGLGGSLSYYYRDAA